MTKILLIIIFAFLLGCTSNPLGPVDETTYKPLTSLPPDSLIVGTYTLDSFSVELIKSFKKYPDETSVLILNADKNLFLKNFPDTIYSVDKVAGQLISSPGHWDIIKEEDKWRINLDFDSIGTKVQPIQPVIKLQFASSFLLSN